VSIAQLQEMYNELHDRVEKGMKVLHDSSSADGIPAAPQDALLIPASPYDSVDPAPVSGDELAGMIDRQEHLATAAPQVLQNEFGA
jgi:hypothetical protein